MDQMHHNEYKRKPVDSLQQIALDAMNQVVDTWRTIACPPYGETFHWNARKCGLLFKRAVRAYIPLPVLQQLSDLKSNVITDHYFGLYHEGLLHLTFDLNYDYAEWRMEDVLYGSKGVSQAVTLRSLNSFHIGLQYFPNLRSITIELRRDGFPDLVVGDLAQMLSEVGTSCPNLEVFKAPPRSFPRDIFEDHQMVIKVSHAQKLCFFDWDSDQKVPNPCCWKLKTLILPHMLGSSTVAVLLQNLGALVTFSGGCNVTSSFHSGFRPRKITSDHQMGKTQELTLHRVSSVAASGRQLEKLSKLCPNLSHLTLVSTHSSAYVKLRLMNNITNLVLMGTTWISLSFILRAIGCHLKLLQVSAMEGVLDLSQLAVTCPQLESLLLHQVRKRISTKPLFFPCLRLLVGRDTVDEGILSTLLESTPGLRELYWEHTTTLRDVEMKSILGSDALKDLEKFVVGDAHALSIQTLDLLFLNCPNLTIVGNIERWNISHVICTKLLHKAQKERWQVKVNGDDHGVHMMDKFITYL